MAKHPAHVALAAFVVGVLTRRAELALVVAVGLVAVTDRAWLAAVAALAVVTGSLIATERLRAIDRSELGGLIGMEVEARGHLVKREREVRGQWRARIDLSEVAMAGHPPTEVDEQVQLRVAGAARLARIAVGDELRIEARLTELPEVPNADFDYKDYLRRAGVHAVLRADRVRPTGARRGGLAGLVDSLRRRAEVGVGAGLDPKLAALARGMVLGQDEQIDARTIDDFKRSGLAHLLAVSGQNITLLALLAFPLLGLAGLSRRSRLWVVLALIAIYVPLTGAGPSIVRAGVMGAAGLAAALSGRPASRWYALLGAAAVTLALDPRAWQDVGWQLSFAAVVGIFALMGPLTQWLRRLPEALRDGLAMTLAATLATAPLMAFHFDQLSLVSVVANLVALPAVAPIMWLGMIDAAVAQLSTLPAELINIFASYCLGYLSAVAHWSAGVPLAVVAIPIGSTLVLVIAYLLLGTAVAAARRRAALPVVLAAVVVCGGAWAATRPAPVGPPPAFEVTFLDIGQGDATLLRTPAGVNVLVDCGPPEAKLYKRLPRLGVDHLDMLVATHPQRDHDGGCPDVRKSVPVGTMLDRAQAGQSFVLGELRLRVVSPAQPFDPDLGDPNLQAIVLVASYGPTDMLLTADAESEVTGALTLPRVELLKVAHHGSADPGLPELLERIQPQIAAIEVGAHNTYGHPTPETLAALRVVPRVYRTDRDGDVRVLALPAGLEVARD